MQAFLRERSLSRRRRSEMRLDVQGEPSKQGLCQES